MKIIVDTREKWTQQGSTDYHIRKYFEKNNIEYDIKKLDEGDYQSTDNPDITIDRKKDLTEMYQCLSNDKSRFMKEVRRCFEKKKKLYILIEHGGSIKSIEDVSNWKPKYGTLTGREICNRLYFLHISYGVEILFCDKRNTAKKIIDILFEKNS